MLLVVDMGVVVGGLAVEPSTVGQERDDAGGFVGPEIVRGRERGVVIVGQLITDKIGANILAIVKGLADVDLVQEDDRAGVGAPLVQGVHDVHGSTR